MDSDSLIIIGLAGVAVYFFMKGQAATAVVASPSTYFPSGATPQPVFGGNLAPAGTPGNPILGYQPPLGMTKSPAPPAGLVNNLLAATSVLAAFQNQFAYGATLTSAQLQQSKALTNQLLAAQNALQPYCQAGTMPTVGGGGVFSCTAEAQPATSPGAPAWSGWGL